MTSREYVGVGITVHWDSDRCVHSERCTMGAPAVFDRQSRPWVNVNAVEADEIARVIDTCPSGALTYTRTDGAVNGRRGRGADEDPDASLRPDVTESVSFAIVTPRVNGPLEISGPVGIRRPDGAVTVAPLLVLCRCGQSASKPHCDGSHERVGFRAEGAS